MPKRAKEKVETEELLKRADSLLASTMLLHSIPVANGGARYFQGQILVSSCCVELYMKILAQLERDEPPLWGHNLKALAGDLSAKSYRRIERAWKTTNAEVIAAAKANRDKVPQWGRMPTDFKTALSLSAEAFIAWRYGRKNEVRSWFIGSIVGELRELILELRPELRDASDRRVGINPHPLLTEPKSNQPVRPAGWAILNYKPAIRARPNPKDRGTGQGR